jgi:rhodanese-related sulfurtransferase
MSDGDAARVIGFIDGNREKQNWYVHCRSGKSRSVATGMFLKKYLKERYGIDVRVRSPVHGVMGMNGYMFGKYCKVAGLKDDKVY